MFSIITFLTCLDISLHSLVVYLPRLYYSQRTSGQYLYAFKIFCQYSCFLPFCLGNYLEKSLTTPSSKQKSVGTVSRCVCNIRHRAISVIAIHFQMKALTSVEPVNATLSMLMWLAMAAPAVGPNPGRMFTTPGGKPACRHSHKNVSH